MVSERLNDVFAGFVVECRRLGICGIPGGCTPETAVECFDIFIEGAMLDAAVTAKKIKMEERGN